MTVLAFLTERPVVKKILEHLGLPATGRRRHKGPRCSSWMSDRLTSCHTTTREGALARSGYGRARRPAAAAAARRGLALYQLEMHASPAGTRGREVGRVDGRRIVGPITHDSAVPGISSDESVQQREEDFNALSNRQSIY
jgi:hypothetical protein